MSLLNGSEVPLKRYAKYALLIGLGYTVLCALYIILSGKVAAAFVQSKEALVQVEIYKGLGFVGISGVGLTVLCFYLFRRVIRDAEELIRIRDMMLLSEQRAFAGILASSIAHDSANMLMVLTGRLDQLKMRMESGADASTTWQGIESILVSMESHLRELREYGRKKEIHKTEFDFAKVLQSCVRELRDHPSMESVEVSWNIPGEKILFQGDKVSVQKMFMNLILNAAEANQEKKADPSIAVTLWATDDGVHLDVEDNGVGIPENKRLAVFHPFYTTKTAGAGLGLLSVKECVSKHNGSVRIDASPLGGARFSINLQSRPQG